MILEALTTLDYKDILSRAGWTALQVFLAVFMVAGESILDLLFKGDWSGLATLFIATTVAGITAALSAVKTILVQTIRLIREEKSKIE